MAVLTRITIQFNTHTQGDNNNGKDNDTILHVFVKNRLSTSLTPEEANTFIGNQLLHSWYNEPAHAGSEINPYIASFINLAPGATFGSGLSDIYTLNLRSAVISDDIVLPVVNIHIQPNGGDQWIFDYILTFYYENETPVVFSSNTDGKTFVTLNQDNRDYSGICKENTFITQPEIDKPVTDAVLTKVTIEFATSNEKEASTKFNVNISNRLSGGSMIPMATGTNILPGVTFFQDNTTAKPSYQSFSWPSAGFPLASTTINLRDIILPVVSINYSTNGDDDQWVFDYQVTFEFTNTQVNTTNPQLKKPVVHRFSSRTGGVILNKNYPTYTNVYQGSPFPSITAPPSQPDLTAVSTYQNLQKIIPLSFLTAKFNQFINNRQGLPGQDPPMMKIAINNSGTFFPGVVPETYFDLQSISELPDSYEYISGPRSLGQMNFLKNIVKIYFTEIVSNNIKLTLTGNSNLPLSLKIVFATDQTTKIGYVIDKDINGGGFWGGLLNDIVGGINDLLGLTVDAIGGIVGLFDNAWGNLISSIASGSGNIPINGFSITLNFTLGMYQPMGKNNMIIDLMNWVDQIQVLIKNCKTTVTQSTITYTFNGVYLNQTITNVSTTDFAGYINGLITQVIQVDLDIDVLKDYITNNITSKIFSLLAEPDIITGLSPRDSINSTVSAILLGGAVDAGIIRGVVVDSAISNNNCAVTSPPTIDSNNITIHYNGPKTAFVEQPPANWPAGNDFSPGTLANIEHIVVLTKENRSFDHMLGYLTLAGRTDIDGLKGTESNTYKGTKYTTSPVTNSTFAHDPPHNHEPMTQDIGAGAMDGFVKSYAQDHGDYVAGDIMQHQTAEFVPTYDLLARDFALCHRWFASHPGPTFCNRFYELTGRLNIDQNGFWEFNNTSPRVPAFTKTIFDYLTDAGVTWKYFEDHYCFLRMFEKYTFNNTNIADFNDAQTGFEAVAKAGLLPSVTFIDPHFVELPPNGNCDGAPTDLKAGQALVERVVNAVVSSPLWSKTMLIITYDENGGFYDHVPPPLAAIASQDFVINTYGIRIPVFVISPWVVPGSVFGRDGIDVVVQQPNATEKAAAVAPVPTKVVSAPTTVAPASTTVAQASTTAASVGGPTIVNQGLHFDNTSILKTIAKRFLSSNPPYMGPRYAAAHDLSLIVQATPRNSQFVPFISYTIAYGSFGMLDVGGANTTPGTKLDLFTANNTIAQNFTFEDAGNGLFYIRTHCGNLYVTAIYSTTTNQPVGIMQATRYKTIIATSEEQAAIAAAINPDSQKWKLTPVNSITANINNTNQNTFIITSANAVFAGKVLQPLNNGHAPGTAIVLDTPTPGTNALQHTNTWLITSPQLPAPSTGVFKA